ncbi:uncharacterized protein LOC130994783 [Salvia miltiorrhiza]|uniref:uncharacterized protein LOC130994783 n=1 Tax=Salvia miltiorrhiza TaxID=226208 RepID=UPI0025AB9E7A|nr:uncharacterized protein LOC130994783 [Salvia miltiorrhiza]
MGSAASTLAELPSELIFEILSRTSLETLERCKAVSKSWKQIIYESTFLPLHCQRTNSLFGYFFQDVRPFNKFQSALVSSGPGAAAAAAINRTWKLDYMKILASCDQGILCCERVVQFCDCEREDCCNCKRFFACKPATSQWQGLPNPKLRYETDTVAIVVVRSTPLRYIIASLYNSGIMQHNCDIFDSEKWAWERIECAAPYGEIVESCRPAITTAGRFFHWLTVSGNVLTLDVKRRSFRCSPLPCDPACKSKVLVEYEGGLGFVCVVEEGDRREMEVWAGAERKMVVDMRGIERALKWAWERIECAAPYGEIVESCRRAITTAGRFFHWLTVSGNVLTLDVKRRSFRCSPLPCDPACKSKVLVEYEGGLGFVCVVEEGDRREMEVWAGAERKMVVDMRGVERALKHAQPVELCSSTVVFLRSADGGGFYNIQNDSFSRVEVPYELRNPKQVFRFRSDWEIVDLKGGPRRAFEPNSPTNDKIISSEPNSPTNDNISWSELTRLQKALFYLVIGGVCFSSWNSPTNDKIISSEPNSPTNDKIISSEPNSPTNDNISWSELTRLEKGLFYLVIGGVCFSRWYSS